MNEKLQRIYYIIGIIQRIAMIVITFAMMGAAYKIYDLSVKSLILIQQYGIEIKELHQLMNKLYKLIDKSWFF